mmetsp:Transcript_1636/g.6389  ORF Transcript_1636/g.6389 Transcript_1636/m.6389 type:complete len:217 (-) Transcript_1636:299-949(-)
MTSYGSSSKVSSRKKAMVFICRPACRASISSGAGGCLRAPDLALRFNASRALCARSLTGPGEASALAHSLTYSETNPRKVWEGATDAQVRWRTCQARTRLLGSSLHLVCRRVIRNSSSRSSFRLVVSLTSLDRVLHSSTSGMDRSVARRSTAGAILMDLAMASVPRGKSAAGTGFFASWVSMSSIIAPTVPARWTLARDPKALEDDLPTTLAWALE